MSTQVMLDTPATVAPNLEIEKLKSLVQNLESQNNALRARTFAGLSTGGEVASGDGCLATESAGRSKPQESTSWLDAIPVLDVDGDSTLDEESSWLYVSPSRPSSTRASSSPYKWMRQDFDEQAADLKLLRRSLVFSLDDVLNDRGITQVVTPRSSAIGTGSENLTNSAGSSPELAGQTTFRTRSPALGGEVKSLAASPPSTNSKLDASLLPVTATDLQSRDALPEKINGSRSAEMLDIQAMARLQEQSLRESFNSLRRASGSSSGSIPQLNLSDLDSSNGSSISGSARQQEGNAMRGSQDTYRVERTGKDTTSAAQQSAASGIPKSTQPAVGALSGSPESAGSLGSQTAAAAAAAPPARKGGLPVPVRFVALPATAAPGSRGASPVPPPSMVSTPRPTSSGLPRASGLPTLGRRSGVPTPRSSIASALRPADDNIH